MTLGVDEVDHVQDAVQPIRELVRVRDPVGDPGGLDLPLRPDEPLVHRGLGGQERAGDLGDLQSTDDPEGECDPRLQGESGVAAGEEQSQPVVVHATEVGRFFAARVLVPHQRLQVVERGRPGGLSTHAVDGPPSGDGGEPRARSGRDALGGPLRHGSGERVGHRLLGQPHVAAELAGERREECGPLLAIRPLDGLGGLDQASCSWLDSGRTSTEP